MKFTWEKPICYCDVCVERRSPGDQKSDDPQAELLQEFCYRCGSPMQTFRIQCLASNSETGGFDCVPKGKIC